MKTAAFALAVLSAWGLVSAFSLFSMDTDPYSTRTGEMACRAPARYLGMGGAGLALADSISGHGVNPASYAFLDYTLITVTYAPQYTTLADGGTQFTRFTDDFPNTELDIPLGRYGVMYGGYRRDRLLSYDVAYKDADGFDRHRFAQGGTYSAVGGYALKLGRFAAGLAANGVFGKTKTGDFITDRPAGGAALEPSRLQRNRFQGYRAEAGAAGRFSRFSLGVALSVPVGAQTISQEHEIIQNYTAEDSVVVVQNRELEEDFLPMGVSAGLAFSPLSRLKVAADGEFNLWDGGKRDLEYRLSLGAELSLADRQNDNYFLDIPLRAGAYLYNPGYKDPVLEQALTFGFSLPTVGNFGLVHFAVEGGRRLCTDDPDLLSETFTKFSIQLTHKARWGRLRRQSTTGRKTDSLQ